MHWSIPILIFLAAELAFIFISLRADQLRRLRHLIIVNLLLITFFAPKTIQFSNWITNVGVIFYSVVATCQALILKKFGHKASVDTIGISLWFLVSVTVLTSLIRYFGINPGNEEISAAISIFTNSSFKIVTASFIAFVFGQFVFIYLYKALSKLRSLPHFFVYMVSIIFLQLIDSLVFFPLAFSSFSETFQIMLVGFVAKSILAIPLYLAFFFPFNNYEITNRHHA